MRKEYYISWEDGQGLVRSKNDDTNNVIVYARNVGWWVLKNLDAGNELLISSYGSPGFIVKFKYDRTICHQDPKSDLDIALRLCEVFQP